MSARRQASTTSLSKYARDGSPDPSARYLDFCNAFWGLNDAGVDVLFARMRGAARTMEEVRNFWKERYLAFTFLVTVLFLYCVEPSSRRTTRNGLLNSPKRHWEGTRLGVCLSGLTSNLSCTPLTCHVKRIPELARYVAARDGQTVLFPYTTCAADPD